MKQAKFPVTLIEAVQLFSDESAAWEFAVNLRWPDGVKCPFCAAGEHSFLSTRKTWQCKSCNRQFSVRKGTIFEDSPIKLSKWLIAMWLIANAKNGISSYELHRGLGVTQKTAWFMLHRIRLAMQNNSLQVLSGRVEADETYIGGKARNMHKAKRQSFNAHRGGKQATGGTGKTIVFGMLERGGKVVTKVLENPTRKNLGREITKHVDGHSVLFTDGHSGYVGMSFHYQHQVIDHAVEYVRGNVHTNGIENYWSLLKRTLGGTYVSVEPFHLFRYLDEQAFRFNLRKNSDGERFLIAAAAVSGKRLTYANLTGKEQFKGA